MVKKQSRSKLFITLLLLLVLVLFSSAVAFLKISDGTESQSDRASHETLLVESKKSLVLKSHSLGNIDDREEAEEKIFFPDDESSSYQKSSSQQQQENTPPIREQIFQMIKTRIEEGYQPIDHKIAKLCEQRLNKWEAEELLIETFQLFYSLRAEDKLSGIQISSVYYRWRDEFGIHSRTMKSPSFLNAFARQPPHIQEWMRKELVSTVRRDFVESVEWLVGLACYDAKKNPIQSISDGGDIRVITARNKFLEARNCLYIMREYFGISTEKEENVLVTVIHLVKKAGHIFQEPQ